MQPEVVALLRCPVCAGPLVIAARGGLDCPTGHHFDAARQGYVDLVAGPVRHEGDSAAMIAARAEFLGAGHFDFLSTALARAAAPALASTGGELATAAAPALPSTGGAGPLVVDVGGGTGHYLAHLLDRYPPALGLILDVAKPALRRAARCHPRALAARADVWRGLPVADGAANLLVNVFAPRNGAEFARILRPDGELLVAVPAAGHLAELVDALGLLRVDPAKEERLEQSLGRRFTRLETLELAHPMALRRGEVATLVGMGPSAWHQRPETLVAAVDGLPEPVAATARVVLHRYRPA